MRGAAIKLPPVPGLRAASIRDPEPVRSGLVDVADPGCHESRLRRGSARRHHRQYRAQQHRRLAGRRRFATAVGRQCLHHCVCGLHSDRGRARRSHRRQADFHGRFCHLHRGVGRLRACRQRWHPDRGESRAGTWRGDSGAELAGAAQPCLSGRKAARAGGWHLGGRRQSGAYSRTAGRRWADRPGRLAIDLSRQSADRPRRTVAERALCPRDHPIAAARNRFAGTDRGDRRAWLSRRCHHRRRFAGLEQCSGDRRASSHRQSCRCCSSCGRGAPSNRCCRCRCFAITCSR